MQRSNNYIKRRQCSRWKTGQVIRSGDSEMAVSDVNVRGSVHFGGQESATPPLPTTNEIVAFFFQFWYRQDAQSYLYSLWNLHDSAIFLTDFWHFLLFIVIFYSRNWLFSTNCLCHFYAVMIFHRHFCEYTKEHSNYELCPK